MQAAHDHHHQGFEEEPIRVHPRATGAALLVGGRWRDRQAVHQFDERDKQALLAYHRGYPHMSFWCGNHDDVAVVASGQPRTRPLFMTRPQLTVWPLLSSRRRYSTNSDRRLSST